MAQYFVDFADYNVGQVLPDWTLRIAAPNSRVAIDNAPDGRRSLAFIKNRAGTSFLSFNPLDNVRDMEILVRFRIDDVNQIGQKGIIYARYGGNSDANTVGYTTNFTPIQNVTSFLITNDNAGRTTTTNYVNYSYQNGVWYWTRFRLIGNKIQSKIWRHGETEPTAWTLSHEHNGATGPWSGLGTFTSQHTIYYSQFSVNTDGGSAPVFQRKVDYTAGAVIDPAPIAKDTPLGVLAGGWGGPLGWGQAYGMSALPAFTVKSIGQRFGAWIERINSTRYLTGASIDKPVSIRHLVNARIDSYVVSKVTRYVANARVEKVSRISSTAAALVEKQLQIQQQFGAFVEYQLSIKQSVNAFIDKRNTISLAVNASLAGEGRILYLSGAIIVSQTSMTCKVGAVIINPMPDKLPQQWSSANKQLTQWNVIANKLPQQWSDKEKQPVQWDHLYYN